MVIKNVFTKILRFIQKDFFFLAPYTIWLVLSLLEVTFFFQYICGYLPTMYDIILICLRIVLFRELTFNKFNFKTLFGIIIVFFSFEIISKLVSPLFPLIFFAFCGRRTSFNKIGNISLVVSGLILAITILCSKVGIIIDYTNATKGGHYLGFTYKLFASTIYFNIIALRLYLKRKCNWIEIILMLLVNYYLFLQTSARLNFVLTIVIILLALFLQKFPRFFENKRIIKFFMISSLVICIVVSLVATTMFWSTDNITLIDKILGNRLSLGNNGIKTWGITFLGQRIDFIGSGLDIFGNKIELAYNYVDNIYVQMLLRDGILFSIIFFAIIMYGQFLSNKRNNYFLMCFFAVIALHGIFDDLILRLYFNTFWFLPFIIIHANFQNTDKKNMKSKKTKQLITK